MPDTDPYDAPTAEERSNAVGVDPGADFVYSTQPYDPATGLPLGTRSDTWVYPVSTTGQRQKAQPSSISITDNTAAVLMILDESDTIDTSATAGNIIAYTNRFYLTAVHEERKERLQILETFGDPAVFFFDEQTKIYNFSGSLLESSTSDTYLPTYRYLWGSAFHRLYEELARGTKLAEKNRIAVLSFENYLLYGWIANLNMQRDSIQTAKQFSFSMIIRDQVLVQDEVLSRLYDVNQFLLDPAHTEVIEVFIRGLANATANLNALDKEILAITAADRRGDKKTLYTNKITERAGLLNEIHQYQSELAAITNRAKSVFDSIETKKPSTSEWPTT